MNIGWPIDRIHETFVDGAWYAAGRHQATWNCRAQIGAAVASGVYLYRLRVGDTVLTKRMTLLK